MKLGEAMYQGGDDQSGGSDAGGGDAGSGGQSQDDVVDADFEEVQDDERKRSA
jgi:molecular chaperone DnaK